jgi:uncharacterized membrane protein
MNRIIPRTTSRRITMLRKTLFLALAAILATLATSSEAQAWGAYHVGYTHYGPVTGFSHAGSTGFSSPYGGAYHSSAYHYGGYRSGGYSAGAYRRW